MMAPGQDSSGAMKARLEFGLWRGAFKKSYSAWANAPHDLKPALLLRGASLARAESWLLAFPEKLSDGEKRFILRSISQSAATKTAGTAEPARPWLRARRLRILQSARQC